MVNPIEGEPNLLYLSVTDISPCAHNTWWIDHPPPPSRLATVHPVGDHEVQQCPDDGHHDQPERDDVEAPAHEFDQRLQGGVDQPEDQRDADERADAGGRGGGAVVD